MIAHLSHLHHGCPEEVNITSDRGRKRKQEETKGDDTKREQGRKRESMGNEKGNER